MPTDLLSLAPPDRTAVLVLEMQNGLVGAEAGDSPIARAVAAHDVVGACATLVRAARGAGVRVVHCLKTERADGAGSSANTPMWRRRARQGFEPLVPGSHGSAVLTELGPEPEDIQCPRTRGVTAFGGTELDPILRNLRVTTVVICGVSVNVGIIAAAADAVSCGYEVIVASDGVGGAPDEYVQQAMKYSLAPIAVLADVAAISSAWGQGS